MVSLVNKAAYLLLVSVCAVRATPGPIGFWLLNDKYNAPFEDMTGRGNDAIPSNVQLDKAFPDSIYKTAHFEVPKNSTVDLGSKDNVFAVNSFSFVAAVKPDGNTLDFNGPILTWAPDGQYGTHIWQNMGGLLYVRIVAPDGSTINMQLLAGIELGRWNTIAVSYNASTSFLKLFVNENTWSSGPKGPIAFDKHLTSGDLQIGYHGGVDYDTRQYRGHISCVSIFDQFVDFTQPELDEIFETCFGELDSQRAPVAFCQVSGDPHYKQFDGGKVHNQGSCKYVLSQDGCTKGVETTAPTYRVIVKTARADPEKYASFAKELIVQLPVYSMEIHMLPGRWAALVDGEPVPSFPAAINEYVNLTTSHARMFLTTSIGLEVLWDGKNFAKVVIEGQFAQRTCGICGVYNRNSSDDLIMGDDTTCLSPEDKNMAGKSALDDDMFVNSWLYEVDEEDSFCVDECKEPIPPPECTEEMAEAARDECGVFERPKGPFKNCINKVIEEDGSDHIDAFQSCVFDKCLTGNNDTLCQHANAFADICANKYDMPVYYRRSELCPYQCPNNSRIDPCASICKQKTCQNPNPTCSETDLTNCEEMCVCKNGFVLHNGECIKESECGCPYKLFDTVIAVGDSVINENCTKECTCDKAGGELTCRNMTCPNNMECSVLDGQRDCHCLPPQIMVDGECVGPHTCRCSGDPHCESFDGKVNKFMGACKYTMAQDNCKDGLPDGEPSFIVGADYWRRNETSAKKKKVSWVKGVIVLIEGYRIELIQGGIVDIDGEKALLPVTLNNHINVYDMPNYVFVTTSYGLKVLWDRTFSVRVTVPPAMMETMCGMCGNFNLDPADDWVIGPAIEGECSPDPPGTHTIGSLTEDKNTFGYSWTFEHDDDDDCKDFCVEPPEDPPCPPEDEARAAEICSQLKNATGPLQNCLAVMDPKEAKFFYDSCVFDVCQVGGNTSYTCAHSAEMMSQCKTLYNITSSWRSSDFCPLECGENERFFRCIPECLPTCTDPTGESCHPSGICEEGCACDEGYVFATDKCVLPVDCGCKIPLAGVSIMPGETQLFKNCSTSCKCEEHGANPVCVDHACRDDQECVAYDGIQTKCQCPAWTSEKNESCVGHPVCSCSGDPHCHQFDKGHFSYQGSCTYVLAQDACEAGLPYSTPNWQVVINNVRPKPKKRVTRVDEVYVIFPKLGHKVELLQGGTVFVDGAVITPPRDYGDDMVSVFDKPNYVYVSAPKLGVQVMWDRVYSVRVIVVPELQGHTCGLCGIYNTNDTDDMIIGPATDCMEQYGDPKIGQKTFNEDIFGSSWFHEMDDSDPHCLEDCISVTPPPDPCDEQTKKAAEEVCAVLSDKHGPLGDCIKLIGKKSAKRIQENCEFDVCALNDTSMVCQHATNLVQDCIGEHGVVGNISQWRSPDLCPMECATDSSYSICGPSCKASCDDIFGLKCRDAPKDCVEGCFCNEPLLYNGEKCVPKDECDKPCSICDFLINPETSSTYDSWVECFTCDSESEQACHNNGSFVACIEPSAICFKTTETNGGAVVSIEQGCQAVSLCPQGAMGSGHCVATADGSEVCTQCSYGDSIPNDPSKPVFRCGTD